MPNSEFVIPRHSPRQAKRERSDTKTKIFPLETGRFPAKNHSPTLALKTNIKARATSSKF
jgi:hypothetical protein